MSKERKTATYKITSDKGGNRYSFYCDLSGAMVCTTGPVKADTPEAELMLAWKSEGKAHFNQCHKCGKWTIDAMYNADVLECVDCAPFEDDPNYCKSCGHRITAPAENCPKCGKPLIYMGG